MSIDISSISQSDFVKINAQYLSDDSLQSIGEDIEFRINSAAGNLLDLQYFILLLNSLKSTNQKTRVKTVFVFDSGQIKHDIGKRSGKTWSQINTYLACCREFMSNAPDIFDAASFNGLKMRSLEKLDFGRIIPLIPVDNDSYSFLLKRVEDVFDSLVEVTQKRKHFFCEIVTKEKTTDPIGENGKKETKRRSRIVVLLPKSGNKKLTTDDILRYACLDYLFSIDTLSSNNKLIELFKIRKEFYSSSEFFEKVKDISMLSFLIFCAYNRYSLLDKIEQLTKNNQLPNVEKYSSSSLTKYEVYPNASRDEEILFNSLDMADGLLQLIENAVHYADKEKGKGFAVLSLRIYKRGQESTETDLLKKYQNYFFGHDNRRSIRTDSNGTLTTQASSYMVFALCSWSMSSYTTGAYQ